jgi:hypothetical protein
MANFWDNDPIATPTQKPGGVKASPQQEKFLAGLTTDAARWSLIAQRNQQMMDIQRKADVGTGMIYSDLPFGIPNPAKAVTQIIHPDDAAALGRMDALNAQTWGDIRKQGMGAVRPYEAQGEKGWQQSIVNTSRGGPTNEGITADSAKTAAEARAVAAFVNQYVHSGQGDPAAGLTAYYQQQGAPDPNAAANAKLKAISAASQGPVQNGATVDPMG